MTAQLEPGRDQKPNKKPFDVNAAMRLIPDTLTPFPKAALFALAEQGYNTAFEQLVACIISIRTLDEDTLPVSLHLFACARTPAQMAGLSPDEINALITPCTFHPNKARQIHAISTQIVAEHGGEMPCDENVLLGFSGVGPKCANLVMGIACGQPKIGVDIHVHRVTNRWGYVQTNTPEATLKALEAKLPRSYWIELNRLLMPFGKFICTGNRPHCSTCPLLFMCPQIGVANPR